MNETMFAIETPRMRLVAVTPASASAELAGPQALARFLEVVVPDAWPPELYDTPAVEWVLRQLESEPENETWLSYYFMLRGDPTDTLIGVGGYKGRPSEDGTVEVGYGVLPAYQRNGFASEATAALIARAFGDARVTRVIAETLPELEPSQGVLRRNGFTFIGEGSEPGVIRFELRR